MEPSNPQLKTELLGIQYMITGLLFEYIITAFYLECSAQLKTLPEPTVECLLEVLCRKFNLMSYMNRNNLDEEMLE
jgi:hypothetical protein